MRLAYLPLLVSLLLIGCKPANNHLVGGKPPEALYPHVVSLSPGSTEIVGSLLGSQLKGRTAYDDFPAQVEAVPVVAGVKPDYEKLSAATKITDEERQAFAEANKDAKVQLRSLVIYDASLYNDAEIAKLEALDVELFRLDANTVNDFIDQIYGLGAKLGIEQTLSSYVDKIYNERALALTQAPDPQPKIATLMVESVGEPMIAGLESFQADLVRSSGGIAVGPSADRFVPIGGETLLALDPDVIVIAGDAEAALKNPAIQSLRAVKEGKIFGIDPDIFLRRGYRVDKAISGIHWGLNKLFPR